MPLYLGLDASTQSLSALLIEVEPARRAVLAADTFRYDDELPAYGTEHGVVRGPEPGVVQSSPVMWAEALDRMMARFARTHRTAVGHIAAVAISAQQHGSVFLGASAGARFRALEPRVPLAGQLADLFTRPLSPVWLDSSTTDACHAIAKAVGGPEILAARTGSAAAERFTAAQIRTWWARDPAAYARTARIHLVSSFLTSLLVGDDAPVDPGDASGTNLMELLPRMWWPAALEATAPALGARLPAIVPSDTIVGSLAPYWQQRYGFAAARVAAGTGDNPSSLIGTGLVEPSRVAVSLGTSDTLFGLVENPHSGARVEGHVFGAPTGGFMGLTCFANGSLARERVRERYGLTWADFSAALDATPPGNGGALVLPWWEPEITPRVGRPLVCRRQLDEDDAPANVRAIVEAQMMAMARHSTWMGPPIREIRATGGGSANRAMLQVMADVFGADVSPAPAGNSACLGAALRAHHADAASTRPLSWADTVAGFTEPQSDARFRPRPAAVAAYGPLRRAYAALEDEALRG